MRNAVAGHEQVFYKSRCMIKCCFVMARLFELFVNDLEGKTN